MGAKIDLAAGDWMRDRLADEDVVLRVGSGDTPLFELLMRRHNAGLFRVVRAIVGRDDAAEDVLQETYLAAFRAIGSYRNDGSVGAWLRRIAVREALRFAGASSRRVGTWRQYVRGATLTSNRSDSPEYSLARTERRQMIERAIDELPAKYRSVLVLRDLEELSTSETASLTDLPEETVRVRLRRARQRLRARLDEHMLVDLETSEVYGFGGERCDRVVARVLDRL